MNAESPSAGILDKSSNAAPAAGTQMLGVQVRGVRLLLALSQVGEIFQPAALQALPYTKSWFLGVVNLRGTLHGVTHLAGFLEAELGTDALSGLAAAVDGPIQTAKLLSVRNTGAMPIALLVDGLLGTFETQSMRAADAGQHLQAKAQAFLTGHWKDGTEQPWWSIDLTQLAIDPQFAAVAQ